MLTTRQLLALSALAAIVFFSLRSTTQEPGEDLLGEVTSVHRSDRLRIGEDQFLRVEARANTFTASLQNQTTLAFAPDGGVTVAWQSRRQDEGRNGVFAQRFNPIGRRVGGETRLGSAEETHRTNPAVAIDADNRSFTMWESFGLDGDLSGVFSGAVGGDSSAETPAHSFTAGPQGQVALAAGAGGEWIALWTGPRGQDDPTQRVWTRRFDPTGRPIGVEQRVSDRPLAEGPASLATWDDGTFVVAWASQHADGRPAGLAARRFAADGRPVAPQVAVNRTNDLGSLEPSVATIPGGGFIVAWMDNRGGDDYDVVARRFDAAGRPAEEILTVSKSAGREQNGATVAVAPDGRACIAWNQRANHGDYDIRARMIDRNGEDLGAAFNVTNAQEGDQALLAANGRQCVAFGPHGQLAVSWSGAADLGDRSAAHLTLLLPDRSKTHGDLNGDAVVDARDLRVLFDVLGQRDLDPIHHVAADLNSDGQADHADLEAFGETNDDAAIRRAGLALLDERARQLDDAAAWLARRNELANRGAPMDPANTMVAEAAVPHDPPVRSDRSVPSLPNGGDRFPIGKAERGFIGIVNSGWLPPDPHMAMGPTHCVSMTNGAIAFHDKSGNRTFQDQIEGGSGFWGSLGATGFVFDPEVIWDPHSDRFMAMACERTNSGGSGLSFFLLAVSDDSDPNGSWFKYRLNVTGPGGGGDIDSPNLGVDDQAVYLTADFFNSGQKYLIHILDKAPLLAGQPVGTVRNLLIQGSQSHGIPVMFGTAPAMYMIEHFESSNNTQVRLHAITNPLTTPQRVTFNVTVPNYRRPGSLPQMGSSVRQSTFDARFWSCVWRDGSLWAAHHHGSNPIRARWYEIETNGWPGSGQNPTLAQAADANLPAGVNGAFNSITVDADGNALMTFARSSSSEFISMSRAYRLASDTPNRMRRAEIIKGNNGPYSSGRWGDYSQASPDPVDPCTIWFTHEYSPSGGSWNTWISRTQMCSLSADVTEISAANGGTANFTLFNPGGAGNLYVVLGSLSGIEPGTQVGPLRVPLNFDAFTNLVVGSINSSVFFNFAGTLDPTGRASAAFNVPNLAGAAGVTMNYAFVEFGTTWEFASNAIAIRVVP